MPEAVIVALIAGIAAVIGSLSGYLVARLRIPLERQKVQIEGVSAEAAAELARAQANDLMWENLTAAYNAAAIELQGLRVEVRELPALRAEVASLRDQVAQFEAIVLTLPDEYRGRFAEVLARRGKHSPKAD